MANKFNPKIYQNKNRIYQKFPGAPNILRLFVWDKNSQEYTVPNTGKIWLARRYDHDAFGNSKRVSCYFDTLQTARAWQQEFSGSRAAPLQHEMPLMDLQNSSDGHGLTMGELIDLFRKRRFVHLSFGTQMQYDQLIRLHFHHLLSLKINEITPKIVDAWLDRLRDEMKNTGQGRARKSFDKELTLLATILRFYENYEDDPVFRFPIKKRHHDTSKVVRNAGSTDRDLSYEDFLNVREEILKKPLYGNEFYTLMTVQYRQALRISEAAAIHWEDVNLNFRDPRMSTIRISRHIEWTRVKNLPSIMSPGFKNSKSGGAVKELPMFPETFEALKKLYFIGAKGLVFKTQEGSFFSYRQIQDAYGQAFKKAGVTFQGTHALRHGGCRLVYNQTGDLAVAGQILGNEDAQTIKIYAKRKKTALNEVAYGEWDKFEVATMAEIIS